MTATLYTRPGPVPCTSPQRHRIITLSQHIGLTRTERHELALNILGVAITSFDDLRTHGADRLIAALTGYTTHQEILAARAGHTHLLPQPPETGDEPEPDRPISLAQRRKIYGLCRDHDYTEPERHHFASRTLNTPVATFRTLDSWSACLLIDALIGIESTQWLISHPLPIATTRPEAVTPT